MGVSCYHLHHDFDAQVEVINDQGVRLCYTVHGAQRAAGTQVVMKALEDQYNRPGKSWLKDVELKQHNGKEVISLFFRYEWQESHAERVGYATEPKSEANAPGADGKPRVRLTPVIAPCTYKAADVAEKPEDFFFLADTPGLTHAKGTDLPMADKLKSFTEEQAL